MSTKDLRLDLLIDMPPQLYTHYANAHKKIFNKPVHLPKKFWPLFSVLEDDLRNEGYDSKDYAYTIIKSLQHWAKDKKLTFIPANVFCGNWAKQRYIKIYNSKTVRIQDIETDNFVTLLHSESLAARKYISDRLAGNNMRFRESVASIQPMLNKDWLLLYHKHPFCDIRRRLVHETLIALCADYGIKHAKSYSELVNLIR